MPIYMNITADLFGKGSHLFEIDDYSFDVEQTLTIGSGGGGAGKVTFHPIVITKKTDSSSPLIFKACGEGLLLPAVSILFDGNHGDRTQPYLAFNLRNVQLGEFKLSSGGGVPTETITLGYEVVQMETLNPESGAVINQVEFKIRNG